jgi:UDP-N-acetylmuramoyl-tripeptide--D-alanyl-D-alanine ligase
VIGTEAAYITNRTSNNRGYEKFRPAIGRTMELAMSNMTAGEAASSIGGTFVYGSRECIISGISIDSRTLKNGDLFFAIRGTQQDGHRYAPNALAKGAIGVVVESAYVYPGEFPAGRVLLKVGDCHTALKDLASSVRRGWDGNLVAITGSMGKTTTKEFAAHILESAYSVYRTPGNYNNLYGLPLALFGLNCRHRFGIFEMGMSAPGEIAEMCRIAAPDTGIITNIAPVHLAFFNSIEEIAQAKGELVEALPANGTLIYNADDPLVCNIAGRFTGNRISFGLTEKSDVRADQIDIASLYETRFRLSYEGNSVRATIPLPGSHYVMNALPAIALGRLHRIPLEQMVARLGSLRQAAMRGQIYHFREGFTLIDDSYNSNPNALIQMIEVLTQVPAFSRRILVAGEMLELGKDSDKLHFDCGTRSVKQGVDIVIAVQGAAREIVRAALAAGVPESQSRFFDDVGSAAEYVAREMHKGDLVLVKGSRGVHMEKIVQALRTQYSEEPQNPEKFDTSQNKGTAAC